MRKTLLLAALLWLVSVAAGLAALGLGELGAPKAAFVPLLTWLATVGLPTTLPVVLLAWLWPPWPLWAFATAALVLSFCSQVFLLRWRWTS